MIVKTDGINGLVLGQSVVEQFVEGVTAEQQLAPVQCLMNLPDFPVQNRRGGEIKGGGHWHQ
ncbi:hypothetical protein [Deinococcus saxicola]|uniref:hypothetical protein n=1 Tax=Deinococcus saxicola TaxID=249406 RepID=UPI0039F0FA6F